MQTPYYEADGKLYRALPNDLWQVQQAHDGHWIPTDAPKGKLAEVSEIQARSFRTQP